jgi:hypothetical protein
MTGIAPSTGCSGPPETGPSTLRATTGNAASATGTTETAAGATGPRPSGLDPDESSGIAPNTGRSGPPETKPSTLRATTGDTGPAAGAAGTTALGTGPAMGAAGTAVRGAWPADFAADPGELAAPALDAARSDGAEPEPATFRATTGKAWSTGSEFDWGASGATVRATAPGRSTIDGVSGDPSSVGVVTTGGGWIVADRVGGWPAGLRDMVGAVSAGRTGAMARI